MIFHENYLLADNSHEISYLIFFKKNIKDATKLASDAVVICTFRIKFVLAFFVENNSGNISFKFD